MENFKGSVLCFRIFDVATEIDMVKAREVLTSLGQSEEFKLRKSSRSMVIKEAPLVISLGSWDETILDETWSVTAFGKLFSFGALSIALRFDIKTATPSGKIRDLAAYLDQSPSIQRIAEEQVHKVMGKLADSFSARENVWNQFEDYIIYIQTPDKNERSNISQLQNSSALHELLLLDKVENLSEQTRQQLRSFTFQYGPEDLVIVDWNCSYIHSEGDAQDIADVIEFALCQLLELRYYDDLLDQRLQVVYQAVKTAEPSIFSSRYGQLSRDAARLYLETSEVVEKIENSLKTIGDFYYAKIFRAAVERFQIKDWQKSIDQKLSNLAEISKLFQSDIVSRRSMWLEIIIIILIAAELSPLVLKLLKSN